MINITAMRHSTLQKALLLLVLFLVAYWVPLMGMVNTWKNSDDYSYGFMIPFVSAYLLWEKREELKAVPVRSAWWVLPPLLLMVAVSLYGILGSSGNVSMPIVPLLIILFTLFCFGREVTRQLMIPLGFLIFMIPVPAVIERTLGIWMKSISSQLGGDIVRSLNIPVHVSGNVIDLGVSQLQVVDACNGLRYLFPLLALGVVYAHFFEKFRWKKVFCVMAAIPIAVFSNALRIGIIGVLTDLYGIEMAEGFMHDFSGFAVFFIAFAFFFVLGRILRLLPPRPRQFQDGAAGTPRIDSPVAPSSPRINRAVATSAAVLVVVGLLSFSTSALPAVKVKGGISGFPLTIGTWSGQSSNIDPELVKQSGAEEAYSGVYRNTSDEQVSLYIGYRSTAFLENENFFHSPTVCLPSSGWQNLRTTTRVVKDVPHFGSITVTEMLTQHLDTRQVVYFWFQTKSSTTYDKNINRFHLALHALRRDNTYDLFIRPITVIRTGESVQDAERRMDGFVRETMGTILSYIGQNMIYGG